MAYTQARVELHDANGGDYTRLHAAMNAENFQQIFKTTSAICELPNGEYCSFFFDDPDLAMAAAKRAAAKVVKSFEITLLVGDVSNSRDYNLQCTPRPNS